MFVQLIISTKGRNILHTYYTYNPYVCKGTRKTKQASFCICIGTIKPRYEESLRSQYSTYRD